MRTAGTRTARNLQSWSKQRATRRERERFQSSSRGAPASLFFSLPKNTPALYEKTNEEKTQRSRAIAQAHRLAVQPSRLLEPPFVRFIVLATALHPAGQLDPKPLAYRRPVTEPGAGRVAFRQGLQHKRHLRIGTRHAQQALERKREVADLVVRHAGGPPQHSAQAESEGLCRICKRGGGRRRHRLHAQMDATPAPLLYARGPEQQPIC